MTERDMLYDGFQNLLIEDEKGSFVSRIHKAVEIIFPKVETAESPNYKECQNG